MKLKVKNIGMYEEIDINLKDISVITGKNDTGKSTVGKILYSFLSTNYKDTIEAIHDRLKINTRLRFKLRGENLEEIDLVNYVKNYIEKEADETEREELNYLLSLLEEDNRLELIELDVIESLENKFFDNIKNINFLNKEFYFGYEDELDNIQYSSSDEEKFIAYEKKNITNVILIDFHSDMILNPEYAIRKKNNIIKKNNIVEVYKKFREKDQLSIKINSKAIEDILTFFNKESLNIGEYKKGKYVKDDVEMPVNSQASGVKNLLLIKTLLVNGHLKKGTLLILDEPETEFHPEWQVLFGMLIYQISTKLGVKVILNTHSSYFVEIMSKISDSGEDKNIGFYECRKEKEYVAKIREVFELTEIYDNLSSAFGIIDNLKEEFFE